VGVELIQGKGVVGFPTSWRNIERVEVASSSSFLPFYSPIPHPPFLFRDDYSDR